MLTVGVVNETWDQLELNDQFLQSFFKYSYLLTKYGRVYSDCCHLMFITINQI